MTELRLLAAIALFRELYDNNKNIYDILAEFIRAGILLNSKWSFNSVECSQILEITFGFEIPEAVIKSCLKNRLISSGELTLSQGTYSATDKFDRTKNINAEFIESQGVYSEITKQLISFVNSKNVIKLNESDAKKLISDFNGYLLGEKITKESESYCSYFIIYNQYDEKFKLKLNRIEEGLVLYVGIKHSAGASNPDGWHGNLTVFLDTEHLFSATGLNGELYKKIFDDFHKLVTEVNENKKKTGTITLRYFKEVQKEVEHFFHAAENLVEKGQMPSSLKTAMVSITNGCKSRSDVIVKKSKFYDDLRRKKIEEEIPCDYYLTPKYNIESSATIASLLERFKDRSGREVAIPDTLKLFTKINCLRKGNSNVGLERVGAIFMTEHGLTTAIALSDNVYSGNGDVPFATNIEFMIERLWFKLNKGFGGALDTPAIFDVVTKAQLVLSSQINNLVSDQFKKLKAEFDTGKITKEQAALLNHELRRKSFRPEEITLGKIEESMEFLKDSYIEKALREKSLLEKEAASGKQAIAELNKLRFQKRENLIKPLRRAAKRQFFLSVSFIYFIIPIATLIYLIGLITESDTKLSIVSVFVSLIPLVPFFKCKLINKYLWKYVRKQYISQRKIIGI